MNFRHMFEKPLDVGVRVINSLLTVGKGQRLGIIAGSGVGKSVLFQSREQRLASPQKRMSLS